MEWVTVDDLGRRADELIDRLAAGQRIRVTRNGRPIAELVAPSSRVASARELLERWRRVPVVDSRGVRRDIDRLIP